MATLIRNKNHARNLLRKNPYMKDFRLQLSMFLIADKNYMKPPRSRFGSAAFSVFVGDDAHIVPQYHAILLIHWVLTSNYSSAFW